MQITLKSSDDQAFTVERALLKHAGTIETLITSMNLDDTEEGAPVMPIPLPNVTGPILKLVIDWLTLHKDDPVAVEKDDNEEKIPENISDMDKAFLKDVEQNTVFDLILAANYLDVKPLLEVTIKTIACVLKTCKGPEAIREKFGITNDFTKEEEDQIRKENEWCEN